MEPITMALMGGSALGNVLSGVGGLFGSSGRAQAAGQAGQQNAMLQAIAMQQAQQRFTEAKNTLTPYTNAGSNAINLLMGYLQGNGAQNAGVGGGGSNLMSTFAPTMAQLEATPGYQFARDQGLGAMTNSQAAKGLGLSGNLVRGLGEYATGFASQTFNQQLDNYLKQNQQAYGMLSGLGGMGVQAGNAIMNGTSNMNTAMLGGAQGVGNALTEGIMGQANANAQGTQSLFGGLGAAVGNLGAMPYMNAVYNKMNNGGLPPGVAYSQTQYDLGRTFGQ